jgi:hypothetical protein
VSRIRRSFPRWVRLISNYKLMLSGQSEYKFATITPVHNSPVFIST